MVYFDIGFGDVPAADDTHKLETVDEEDDDNDKSDNLLDDDSSTDADEPTPKTPMVKPKAKKAALRTPNFHYKSESSDDDEYERDYELSQQLY